MVILALSVDQDVITVDNTEFAKTGLGNIFDYGHECGTCIGEA